MNKYLERVAAIGIGLGLVGGIQASTAMHGLLAEVSPLEPAVLTCVRVLLGPVEVVVCLIPARRATKVDPMTALRTE